MLPLELYKVQSLKTVKNTKKVGMKMEIRQLMCSMVLILSVFTRIRSGIAEPETATVWSDCGNSGNYTYRNGSEFQIHLNEVLESLVKNVYPSGYNISSAVSQNNSNNTVYGLVQCRGDLDSSDCKQCVSTAKGKLVQGCRKTSGFIQLDGCFLRYDTHNFYNDNESRQSKPINVLCNTGNSSRPQQFKGAMKALLSNVTAKAEQNPKLFAEDSVTAPYNLTESIYSLAQCWRDLSRTSCGSCLTYAFENIFNSCNIALGAQFESQHCYLRYEIYEFFNSSVLSALAPESPSVSSERKIPKVLGITLGVVVGGSLGFMAAIGFWSWNYVSRLKRREQISRVEGGESFLSLTIANPELIFKYDTLREATSNFNVKNKLGEGGFGSVFKGVLPDGRDVAVKRLYLCSRQGDAQFLNEANLISLVQHRNLVKLLGCSVESSEKLLVYEYLQNSSLDKILFGFFFAHSLLTTCLLHGSDFFEFVNVSLNVFVCLSIADATKCHLLNWKKRYEIIVGTACGLAYLHEESEIRIIHRDIKASNILLDDKYKPKIADFGLARFFAEDQSHVSTRIAGTLGYMAPEYALRGQLTEKADVFSFGVLILEIIGGRKNQTSTEDREFLIERTWRLYKEDRALEVMDPILKDGYSWEEGIRVIKIALLCTQAGAALRPSMSRVVSLLTSEAEHLPSPTRPAFIDLEGVGAPQQVKGPSVIDPSSSILEPR